MKIRAWLQKTMAGRSGPDELSHFCSVVGWLLVLLSLLLPWAVVSTVLCALGVAVTVGSLLRMFSRNTYKRREENRYYLRCRDTVKRKLQQYRLRWAQRKEYHFFRCEKCRTLARVPRGRGKICITCPHCKHEFIRKS